MGHLSRGERHYATPVRGRPGPSRAPRTPRRPRKGGGGGGAQDGNLVFTGVEDDPGTLATLRRMGFHEPSSVAAMVRGWHHGRPRATRSQRARELLTEMMPRLLAAFGRQHDPDRALARFDSVLTRLPAGVQVLSLLHRNPACWTASPASWAPRRSSPTTWRATRRPWTGCWPAR
jgi:glutamate-ammonia-ligase adenylyltransferase